MMSTEISETITDAVRMEHISVASAENLLGFLEAQDDPIAQASIAELLEEKNWQELNDRFYQTLKFGTGGLRGRTVGRHITSVELGNATGSSCPEHPCTGTNAMNFYNVSRATQGLAAYLHEVFASKLHPKKPAVCIAHDTRYFSRSFSEYAARIFSELGCDVFLFEGCRSTPELSFAIRELNAQAGIVITASHNPPSYNGYKVYFSDGGQIVEPHAGEIISRVRGISKQNWECLPPEQRGSIHEIGKEIDDSYLARLKEVVIDPEVLPKARGLQIVFSPLHGTGGTVIPQLLDSMGLKVTEVPEQAEPDGAFPTVASPNPEEKAALSMAIDLAEKNAADLVLATDPDADRLGAAARNGDDSLELLTGNQIGSVLAWHRIRTFFDKGILNDSNKHRAVLIKTFVTSDLQKAIAEKYGIACVETLTGFKYIGAKLEKYEAALPSDLRANYRHLSLQAARQTMLAHSRFFVFGGEESYGYSGADFVRDKDANMAALMLMEAAAFAKSEGTTLHGLLDRIYLEFGLFLERGESLVFEGAEGAAKIEALLESYLSHPPDQIAGRAVLHCKDFRKEGMKDAEGDPLPAEAMLMFALEGGARIAVRPSGTEPKIKFYLFVSEPTPGDVPNADDWLLEAKNRNAKLLDSLWHELQADATNRVS